MDDRFEEMIKEALIRGTDASVKNKDQVWQNIQSSVKIKTRRGRKMAQREARKKGSWAKMVTGLAAAAAVLFIGIMSTTPTGKAAVDRIREMFEPQKKIVEELEGMEEQTDVSLKEGRMGYIIYLDEERYVMEHHDGKDVITTREKFEGYPEVLMEISQVDERTPQDMAVELEAQLKEQFSKVENLGEVESPIKGILLHAIDGGDSWDDVVVEYHLVDNTKGGTFVIRQQYFLEAAEGHGVRLDNMLKEFKIVEIEE